MAEIHNIANFEEVADQLRKMDDGELMGCSLVQQGAIHAVSTLIGHGASVENAAQMLESLREQADIIRAEFSRRGKPDLFEKDQVAAPAEHEEDQPTSAFVCGYCGDEFEADAAGPCASCETVDWAELDVLDVKAPSMAREYIYPVRMVADLVNNLLMLDQALPVYGAQSIEHEGRRRTIAIPPTLSRERVKDGRWIGEGEAINTAIIWTRAEQPNAEQALRAEGIEQVARMLQKRADGYASEHLSTDPDTGTTEGGQGRLEYWNWLLEMVDDVRAMAAKGQQ